MKSVRRRIVHGLTLFVLLVVIPAVSRTAWAATVVWTGAGGDNLWNTPANWSGGNIPGPGDDVLIDVSGDPVIFLESVGATVRSVQCTESFLLDNGTLSLTGGSSTFSGPVSVNLGSLNADGATTVVNFSGPTTVLGLSCFASAGAQVWLTNAAAVDATSAAIALSAHGAGTAIHAEHITTVIRAENSPNYSLTLSAIQGGLVNLGGLQVTPAPLNVYSDGPASVVDLSGLAGVLAGVQRATHEFSAQQGGVIRLPNVTGLIRANLSIQGDSRFEAGPLTTLEDTSIFAGAGAQLSLTNLTEVRMESLHVSLMASGPGSVLDLSEVTNVVTETGNILSIAAFDSARVDVRRLAKPTRAFSANASSAGSEVDLSAFSGDVGDPGGGRCSFSAAAGGAILMPHVTGLISADVSVAQDGTVGFGALTRMEGCTFSAYGGATIWLTNFSTLNVTNGGLRFLAQDVGSAIHLPNVTNLVASGGGALTLSALDGGWIDLQRLREPDPALDITVRGDGSLLDLSSVAGTFSGANVSGQTIQMQGGTLRMPGVDALERAYVYLSGGAILETRPWRSLVESSLSIDGTTNDLSELSIIADSVINASGGAKIWLTNVTTLYVTNGSTGINTSGEDTAIYLPNVTNVVYAASGQALYLSASSGGVVDLHRLANPTGRMSISSTAPGSVVDLSSFHGKFAGTSLAQQTISVGDRGTVLIPDVTALDFVSLYLTDAAGLSLDQFHSVTRSTVSVYACSNDCPSLTNISGSYILANNGSKLWLPGLTTLELAQDTASLQAFFSGSAIHLPNATDVVLGPGSSLSLQAQSGGLVDLHAVKQITGSMFTAFARYEDSVIDLSGLSALTPAIAGSSLHTAQGGVILLNDHAMLIANVSLDFESSPNGILPTFANPGTDLILYAPAWSAYRIEARDVRAPENPWTLHQRMAMTNVVQVVSPRPSTDLAFRVTPLLADPPELRIDNSPSHEIAVTLFGLPGQTYRIESRPTIETGTWQEGPAVTLTNAFHIAPPAAGADPSRFYRVRKL